MKKFRTPKMLYCVAGYEFPTDEIRQTFAYGVTLYLGNTTRRLPDHATVEAEFDFLCVVHHQGSKKSNLTKNASSKIPRGALEMLFEDGVGND
jgi:hypothetical protein